MLGFVIFIVRQCFQLHLIQLDLLKRPRTIKAIKNSPKLKVDFDNSYYVKLVIVVYGNIKP